ncbi:MAG: radical SAM family heme chaperone HemW, partial [Acidobacteriota bacterium]
FGGGTPSLLEEAALGSLLDSLRRRLPIAADAQLFFEANPEDIDHDALRAWRRLGVSYLSLGVQSFDDDALAFLGRRHDGEQARTAARDACRAGFDTVSIDLIYALPKQSEAAWRRQLDLAIELGSGHLSCYQLTIEPATPFGKQFDRGELTPPPQTHQADLFHLTHTHLDAAGYRGYEVSNFARSDAHRSRHNQKYWTGRAYLGIGPSAHSFDGHNTRWWNDRHLERWRRRLLAGERPIAGEEELDERERAVERLILGFRTRDGIDLAVFRDHTGIDLTTTDAEVIDEAIGAGHLELVQGRLRPTLIGMAIADTLVARFTLDP